MAPKKKKKKARGDKSASMSLLPAPHQMTNSRRGYHNKVIFKTGNKSIRVQSVAREGEDVEGSSRRSGGRRMLSALSRSFPDSTSSA